MNQPSVTRRRRRRQKVGRNGKVMTHRRAHSRQRGRARRLPFRPKKRAKNLSSEGENFRQGENGEMRFVLCEFAQRGLTS
jgi:hypothetical protein